MTPFKVQSYLLSKTSHDSDDWNDPSGPFEFLHIFNTYTSRENQFTYVYNI